MEIKKLLYEIFRIILGVVFLSSGIGKFYGTSGLIGPGYMFKELAQYDLLLFAIFVALAELIIGYLLLIRKFSTVGAVMLFPMITNILVVVISLKWQGTPLIDAIFLLMNLYLLYYDRHKLYPLLGISNSQEIINFFKQTGGYIVILIIIILGVLLSYSIDNKFRIITRIGLACIILYGAYNFLKNKNGWKNNAPKSTQ